MGGLTLPKSAGKSSLGVERADQKVQCVFILRRQLRETGNVSPGSIHLRLRLIKIQFGGEPNIIAPFDQIVGALLRLKGGLRQLKVFPISGKGEIRVGDRGHQQDLRAAAGLLRGEVLLQRPIFQAADAAEEVDLPGNDAQIYAVLFHGHPLPGGRKIGRHPFLDSRCRPR